MMLISYFISKKSGASDATAAMVAAGAGAATYYATTETAWGQNLVSTLDSKWESLMDDGVQVKNTDGTNATAPTGAVVKKDADGNTMYSSSGSVLWELPGQVVKTAGDTLSSWGSVGTAAVIGAGSLASDGSSSNLIKWGLAAVALILVMK